MANLIIFSFLIPGLCHANLIVVLTTLVKHLRPPLPLQINYNATRENKTLLTKKLSQAGLSLNWIEEPTYSETFLLVVFENDISFAKTIGIDQQIYFLKTTSLELFEKYMVNKQTIVQKLGHFDGSLYIPMKSIQQNFLKRRKNFYGYAMVAMTAQMSVAMQFENFLDKAPYFSSNKTYDVTDLAYGSFYDVWKHFEKSLNFTTRLYTRDMGKWGVPVQHKNESIEISDGYIKDVMSGTVDAFITAVTVLHSRTLVIDYLQPMLTRTGGIFVKKDSVREGLDYGVFFHPFEKWTWIVMVMSSMIVSVCIFLIWKVSDQTIQIWPSSINVLMISFQANLGIDNFGSVRNKFTSTQMIFFTSLLMGNVIWMSYNGALLSQLISPKVVKPFHDLETLVKSNYRFKIIVFFSLF